MSWTDDAAWRLWKDLIPLVLRTHIPLVATLLAVCVDQRGGTPLAGPAVRRALSIDPTYPLAQLIAIWPTMCFPTPSMPKLLYFVADKRIGSRLAIVNAYLAGSTAARLAATHDLSLSSLKRILRSAQATKIRI